MLNLKKSEKNILNYIRFFPLTILFILSILIIIVILRQNKIGLKDELNTVRNNFYNSEKEKVISNVNSIIDMIEYEIKNNKNLTLKELQENLLLRINYLNQNKENYVYIIDENGNFLAHKLPELLYPSQKDKNTKTIIDNVLTNATSEGNFIEYESIPQTYKMRTTKVSYVKKFEKFNWFIGCGFYPVILEKMIDEKTQKLENENKNILIEIFSMLVASLLLIIFLMFFFSKVIENIFEKYKQKNFLYQKKLKRALNSNRSKLNDSLETINNYIAVSKTDKNGVITYVSDEFCKNLGFTKEELIGNTHALVKHPDMDNDIFKNLWSRLKHGETYEGTIKNLTKDGRDFWFEVLIIPELDINDEIVGYTALRKNITDRKNVEKLNKTLEEKVKVEVEKNREKDALLAQKDKMLALSEMLENIAHHWRQPLSIISTAASGIKLKNEFGMLDNESLDKYIDEIVNNSQKLSQTLDNFRDFAKSNDEIEIFDIFDVYKKTKNIMESTLYEHKIFLIEDVEHINLKTTKTEIIRVFINLFTNSKDAFDKINGNSKKIIFVNIYKKDEFVYIKIKDTAGGIPENIIDSIFEPYFTTKHKIDGNGMGLYLINKYITNILKGEILVSNIEFSFEDINYKGAQFNIKFPYKAI